MHKLDLIVERGGITALLGANGAGKTTMLRAICNMKVRTTGRDPVRGPPRSRARQTEDIVRLGIAHVPDGRGTFVHLSVEENLALGAYTRRDRTAVAQDFERIYGYFPRLKERAQQQAGTLSGGEQQMLAIARALMLRPKLSVARRAVVRPGTAGGAGDLSHPATASTRRTSVSMLLVEQNASLALALATHVYLLETGRS